MHGVGARCLAKLTLALPRSGSWRELYEQESSYGRKLASGTAALLVELAGGMRARRSHRGQLNLVTNRPYRRRNSRPKRSKLCRWRTSEPDASLTFSRQYPAEFSHSRPLRVLFLGQINLRKGIGPLIDAIRLLVGEPVEFWFVGPVQIPVPPDLRDNPQVRWIGPVSRDDTARLYQDADVFLFPTFSDGFGLTQLEAQAWKLPIISTKFCGDVVEDDINGRILSEVTSGEIAANIRSASNGSCAAAEILG